MVPSQGTSRSHFVSNCRPVLKNGIDNPDELLSSLNKAASFKSSVCRSNVALQSKCFSHWRAAEKLPVKANSESGNLPRICWTSTFWLSNFREPAATVRGSENPRRESTAERICAWPETDG